MRPTVFRALLCFVAAMAIGSSAVAQSKLEDIKKSFERPEVVTFPENAPYSPQIATLGKMLFFDPRLSGAQNMSCATCHNPSFGWETPVEKAIGGMNVALDRHAPTTLNLAEAGQLFWDGRAKTLEEQAAGPITHPKEMAANFPDLVRRLNNIPDYHYWFNQLFPGSGVSRENILTAIATFERTLVSGWTPFDSWIAGDEDAISAEAKLGFELFAGKAGCANCHLGWNFTDHLLHDIGILTDDVGGAALYPEEEDMMHAFKTPGLRNITLRAPYMHNGSMKTLKEVITHYSNGGADRPSKSWLMPEQRLTLSEIENLVAFLESVTEPNPNIEAPALPSP